MTSSAFLKGLLDLDTSYISIITSMVRYGDEYT